MIGRLLSVRIRHEHDIVGARQRARQIGGMLGLDAIEQTRVATAVSELARNAFQYAGAGTVEYSVEGPTSGWTALGTPTPNAFWQGENTASGQMRFYRVVSLK